MGDDVQSWSYQSNQTAWHQCQKGDIKVDQYENFCGITNESAIPYADEDLVLAEGLKRLELAQASGKPWFVGVGNHRPHWAYRNPPGFYGDELYPGDIVKAPVHAEAPQNSPYMS